MPTPTRKIMSTNKRRKMMKKPQVVSEEPPAPDWINNLNDDCLVKIFKYLSLEERLTVETVCKRWKQVAKLAWNDIKVLNLSNYDSLQSNGLLRSPVIYVRTQCAGNMLRRCGRYLKELELGYLCDPTLLPLISQHCENLTRLVINFNICGQYRIKFLPPMPNLRHLEVKMLAYTLPDNDYFRYLPHETLTELHLWGVENSPPLSDEFITTFNTLQKLMSLTLNDLTLQSELIDVICQKSNLRFLSLAKCGIDGDLPHINLLTNLEHLNLQGLNVDDNFLVQLSENNENLKYLNLSENIRITNNGLTNLQTLSQLEQLILNDITGITDHPLSRMYNLKKLECEKCLDVNDPGIIKLLRYAPNLEYLNLAGSKVSVKVLTEATEITKRRTNDVRLEVVVTADVKDLWEAYEDYSPLLDVTAKEFDDEYENEDDDENDDGGYGYDPDDYCSRCGSYHDDPYRDFNFDSEDE